MYSACQDIAGALCRGSLHHIWEQICLHRTNQNITQILCSFNLQYLLQCVIRRYGETQIFFLFLHVQHIYVSLQTYFVIWKCLFLCPPLTRIIDWTELLSAGQGWKQCERRCLRRRFMSGPLPSRRLLELPMKPGEMLGMPQPHLASCNGQFHLKQPRTVQPILSQKIEWPRKHKHTDNAIKW